jgi:ParB/RepB/Spo0J family partition protein
LASAPEARLAKLDPRIVKIPEVRVTSYFDDELKELFKHSIKEVGVQQPILVAFDGNDYWVIDGRNRLEEARLQGLSEIDAVVIKADMKTVLLKNLSLNVLRGKLKPTEMLQVVNELYSKYNMDIDTIARQSGLRRDYVEKLLSIAKCSPAVITALDEGKISVGHAFEISRVQDFEVQERLLAMTNAYNFTVKYLHDVVDETLKVLEERKKAPKAEKKKAEPKIPTAKCEFCGQEWPIRKVTSVTICVSCYGIAHEATHQKLEELKAQAQAAREAFKQQIAAAVPSDEEGG